MNVGDVRVVERRERLGFPLESRETIGIIGKRLSQDFDRDIAIERCVSRAIHLAHTTGAEGSEDCVGTETRA